RRAHRRHLGLSFRPMSGTLVVGFDGATLDLVERWMAEGLMPNLSAVCADGAFAPMRSTYPYNSAVAWTSLTTGASPGRHGIFDSAERELVQTLEARARFVTELARSRPFDLLLVNFEATDGAHHFFWQHFDPTHPRHDPRQASRWGGTIARVYQATDRHLGSL